ncbi:T9SS type A sorting domain-containing protein [bacterium]|nr:T9SS type A sorting domain-containing protein [bacterium]MBU1985381.1 T9SS type A sorting domain-containing protein [bacterium]
MKNALMMLWMAAMLAFAIQAFAVVDSEGGPDDWTPVWNRGSFGSLDNDTCMIDYTGLVNGGGNPGTVHWPTGHYSGAMGIFRFNSNCEPDPLYAYCVDITHGLNQNPYCVVIYDSPMNPHCAVQIPALAYIMTWWGDTSALGDDILQMALWKLDDAPNGIPYYCPPLRPNQDSVFHTAPAINNPANALVTFATGETDGLPKNVMMPGDSLRLTSTGPIINGSMSELIVHIQLRRGFMALRLGNTGLGGVKVILTTSEGTLSEDTVHTDEFGHAQVTVSNPIAEGLMPVTVLACTKGYWPRRVDPCNPNFQTQRLVIAPFRTMTPFDTCVTLEDHFLAAELASFEAYSGSSGIEIVWRTASETNVDRWEIERSVAGESSFSRIASLAGAGAASGHVYRFTDQTAEPGVVYEFRLVDVDLSGIRTTHDWIRTASFHGDEAPLPAEFFLADNYPNPFNPETRIRFSLPEGGFTSLKVYDAIGREVATLANGHYSAGQHAVVFRANDLPTGLYFYKLTAGGSSITKKMVLMK